MSDVDVSRLARIEKRQQEMLDAFAKKDARDREWQSHAMRLLQGMHGVQADHEWDIRALKSAKWLTTAIYSRAPAWVAAGALVGIMLAAATIAWAR